MAYNRQTFVDGQILTAAHLNTIENNIDERFKEAIVNPATASVGQTLVVKSVDENGKPTEWEAKTGLDSNNLQFIDKVIIVDMSELMPGFIKSNHLPPYVDLLPKLVNSSIGHVPLQLTIQKANGLVESFHPTRYELLTATVLKIYFGDDVCPIIINADDDTITRDPNWVAPEEVALKSEVPTDAHINELISTALASFTNGEEVSY